MNAGDLALERKDAQRALHEYSQAEKLQPNNAEMVYWHAVALVGLGRVDQALPLFKRCFQMNSNWREVTPRVAKAGLLPEDRAVLERILEQGRR